MDFFIGIYNVRRKKMDKDRFENLMKQWVKHRLNSVPESELSERLYQNHKRQCKKEKKNYFSELLFWL